MDANVGQIKLKVVEGSGQTPKYLVSATTDVCIYKVKAAALKWCIRRNWGSAVVDGYPAHVSMQRSSQPENRKVTVHSAVQHPAPR